MQIIELARTDVRGGGCVALGSFDGVHAGHRRLLTAAKQKSTERRTIASVLLFSEAPHGAPILLPMEERLSMFASLGIARAYIFDFSELKTMPAEDFVRTVLAGTLSASAVFCGYNYRFGAGARGDAPLLCRLAAKCGMDGFVTDPVEVCGGPVSSTRIRDLLAAGEIESVNTLLSYPYYLHAPVTHGKALGHTLGFATVNQTFAPGTVTPAYGVYDTVTVLERKRLPSVTNVGVRPTVDGQSVNAETHILDFDGDLYGKTVRVEFYRREREERRFPDTEALQKQIAQDAQTARAYFAERSTLCHTDG